MDQRRWRRRHYAALVMYFRWSVFFLGPRHQEKSSLLAIFLSESNVTNGRGLPLPCRNNHPEGGPLNQLPNGACRHCDRDAQARYKARRDTAMTLYRSLEERGIRVTKDNVHRLCSLLETIGAMHPEVIDGYLNKRDADEIRRVLAATQKTVPTTGSWDS